MPMLVKTPVDNSVVRRTLYVLFAFSGFSGLIYESIWTHYLKLFLGCAAYVRAPRCSMTYLPPGEIRASLKNNYLLTVAMLSFIAQNRFDEANHLFIRYEYRNRPPIEIRLLVAYANRGAQKPGGE
jgi:hypothetical protein